MFVGSKNFPGSWIHNFIGSKFKIILRNIKNACCTFIYICGDLCLWARATHESHKYWSPTNNDGSTVLHVSVIISFRHHQDDQAAWETFQTEAGGCG